MSNWRSFVVVRKVVACCDAVMETRRCGDAVRVSFWHVKASVLCSGRALSPGVVRRIAVGRYQLCGDKSRVNSIRFSTEPNPGPGAARRRTPEQDENGSDLYGVPAAHLGSLLPFLLLH